MDDLAQFLSSSSLKESIKGKEPDNLQEMCLQLCQKYLAGNWKKCSVNDIEVKRMTGGLTNQVYHCRMKAQPIDGQIKSEDIVIRLYGEKYNFRTYDKECPRLGDMVVSHLASINGLGPKLYGLFKNGEIQKYYQHRIASIDDLYDTDLLNQIAVKLAQFHAMQPPLAMNRLWCQTNIKEMHQHISESYGKISNLLLEYNCKTLMEFDFLGETDWMLDYIQGTDSPLVFSHNDFRLGNIMISEKQVIFNDFEYSDYYYRGFDFGSIFCEFYKPDEKDFQFKDETIVKTFIQCYINEMEAINGKEFSSEPINSVEHIFDELKQFSLVYMVFVIYAFLLIDIWKLPIDQKSRYMMANGIAQKYLASKKVITDKMLA